MDIWMYFKSKKANAEPRELVGLTINDTITYMFGINYKKKLSLQIADLSSLENVHYKIGVCVCVHCNALHA